ncbi:hypothetical protein SAMN05518845_1338 [Variovorax sp. YR750]|nr:hypothetical protein SAMN05518845_1338 [Variovorax sp. YR750]SOD30674.1 hypothetical protein SAMN05518800_6297 [Variovorax sp. YR752]
MKNITWASALAVTLLASTAFAQTPPADKATARAERKAQGAEATRSFAPGEGDPKPEAKAKVSPADRAAARQARKQTGADATRTFTPGEGDPKPAATAKLSREERSAERKARRAEVAKANKAGQLPSYGENAGSK